MFGGQVPNRAVKSTDGDVVAVLAPSGPVSRQNSRRLSSERIGLNPAIQKIQFEQQLQAPAPLVRHKSSISKSPSISSINNNGNKSNHMGLALRPTPSPGIGTTGSGSTASSGQSSESNSRRNSNPNNIFIEIPRHLGPRRTTSSEPLLTGTPAAIDLDTDTDSRDEPAVEASNTSEFSDEMLINFLKNSRLGRDDNGRSGGGGSSRGSPRKAGSGHLNSSGTSPANSAGNSLTMESRNRLIEEMRLINKRANLSETEKNEIIASALAIDTSKSARRAMQSYKEAAYERVVNKHGITDLDTSPYLDMRSPQGSSSTAANSRSDESPMSFSTAAAMESEDEDEDKQFVKMVEEVERCRGRMLQKASYVPSAATHNQSLPPKSAGVGSLHRLASNGNQKFSPMASAPITTAIAPASAPLMRRENSRGDVNASLGSKSKSKSNSSSSMKTTGDSGSKNVLSHPGILDHATASTASTDVGDGSSSSSGGGSNGGMESSYDNTEDIDELLELSGISLNKSLNVTTGDDIRGHISSGSTSDNNSESVNGSGNNSRSLGFSSSSSGDSSMNSRSVRSELQDLLSSVDTIPILKNSGEFTLSDSADTDTDAEHSAYIENLLAASKPSSNLNNHAIVGGADSTSNPSSKAVTSRRGSSESVPNFDQQDSNTDDVQNSISDSCMGSLRMELLQADTTFPRRRSQPQTNEVVKSVTSYFDELLDSTSNSMNNSFRGSASLSQLENVSNAGLGEGNVRASFFTEESLDGGSLVGGGGGSMTRLPPMKMNPSSSKNSGAQLGSAKDPSPLRVYAGTPSYMTTGPGASLRTSIHPTLYEEVGKSPSLFSPLVSNKTNSNKNKTNNHFVSDTPHSQFRPQPLDESSSRMNSTAIDILGLYGTRHRSNVPPLFSGSPEAAMSPPLGNRGTSAKHLHPPISSPRDFIVDYLDSSFKDISQKNRNNSDISSSKYRLPGVKDASPLLEMSPPNTMKSKNNMYIEAEELSNARGDNHKGLSRGRSAAGSSRGSGMRPKSGNRDGKENGPVVDQILTRGNSASSASSVSTNYLLYGHDDHRSNHGDSFSSGSGSNSVDHNMSYDAELDRSFNNSFNFGDDGGGFNVNVPNSGRGTISGTGSASGSIPPSRNRSRRHTAPDEVSYARTSNGTDTGNNRIQQQPERNILDTTLRPSRNNSNSKQQSRSVSASGGARSATVYGKSEEHEDDDEDAEEEDVHVVYGPGQWGNDTGAVDLLIGKQIQFPRRSRNARRSSDSSSGGGTVMDSKASLISSLTDQTFQSNSTLNNTLVTNSGIGAATGTMNKFRRSGNQGGLYGLPGDSNALLSHLPPVNELSPLPSKTDVKSLIRNNNNNNGTSSPLSSPTMGIVPDNIKALQQALTAGHSTGLRLAKVPTPR